MCYGRTKLRWDKSGKMTAYAKSWLHKTKKHSTQISGEGEKERRVLFEKLFSKMEKSRIEIDSLLNYVYS